MVNSKWWIVNGVGTAEFRLFACLTIDLDKCNQIGYNKNMIKSFKHKGLEQFYLTGSIKGIQNDHLKKIRIILTRLNQIDLISDINVTSFNLHQLKGELKNHWSIKVNGNWRITFKFEDKNVYIIDYQDYH